VRASALTAFALAGLAFLTVACSGGDPAERRGQAAATSTASSTILATTTSSSSPAAVEERPEVALVRLLRLRNEAFSNPDPSKADAYLTPECTCYQQEQTSLPNLRDKGWHWETPMFEVVGIEVSQASRPDLVTLTVVARRPPERVVDASGALANPQGPGLEPTGYSYLLTRKDGAWKIADNFKLDLSPEVIRQVMARGVPS
jgi:hypothetical protein